MRTISSITEKKIGRNLWLVFLANEINATDRDITDPTEFSDFKTGLFFSINIYLNF